ncbi:MAG: hypothetical protein ACRC0X_04200 [Brevinema sp.]
MKLLLFFMMLGSYLSAATNHYQLQVSDGIYQDKVDLVWDRIPEAEYYRLERVYNTPFSTKLGKKAVLETNILIPATKATSFTDKEIPFGQYLYTVTAYKTNITSKEESNREKKRREKSIQKTGEDISVPLETNVIALAVMSDVGHRQVTDTEFFLEFQKTIDSSLPRIKTMKMLNFFGEKKPGWRAGQLVYKTTGIFRKPFRVTIDYKDFVDQNLKLNGTYEVQIFKLFAQEGKLVGTFQVDGIYKGTVTHNLIIDGGQSVGGTYDVQQEGKSIVSLPYDVTSHPLDDSQYEEALKGSLNASEEKE